MSTLTQLFTSIANAIRAKKGTSALIQAEDFPTEISGIEIGELTEQEYETALDLSVEILGLDSAYTPVQYIESTGTQYINLDFISGNSTNFIMKLATTNENPTSIKRILGGYNSSNRFELALHNSSSNGIFMNYNNGSVYSQYVPTLNTPFIVKKDGAKLILPNGEFTLSSGEFSSEKSCYIFASNRSSTEKFIGRIYYCKIYNGTTLIRKLIPCVRQSDSEAGFYDLANSKFYTNSGTGTFIAGPSLE